MAFALGSDKLSLKEKGRTDPKDRNTREAHPDERKTKGIRRLKKFLLDIIKSEPELIKEFLGVEFFQETISPPEVGLIGTYVLHPEHARALTSFEDEAPELFSETTGKVNPAAHVRIHAAVLENALTNREAARALDNLLTETCRHHQNKPMHFTSPSTC